MGNGKNTSFWNDCWIGNASLPTLFPPLYNLTTKKPATENNFWEDKHEWNISYRRNLKEKEFEDWLALMNLLSTVNPTTSRDKWTWKLDKWDLHLQIIGNGFGHKR